MADVPPDDEEREDDYEPLNDDNQHNNNNNKLKKCLIAQGVAIVFLVVAVASCVVVLVLLHSPIVNLGGQRGPTETPMTTCHQNITSCNYSTQKTDQSDETKACNTKPLLTNTKVLHR